MIAPRDSMQIDTMFAAQPVVNWTIDARFEVAVRLIRRALTAERLEVCCELDTASRLRRELGISLKNNVVLWVDEPLRLLEATVMSPVGALFVPEPVIVVDGGSQCRASIRPLSVSTLNDLPPGLRRTVIGLHERIISALDRAGHQDPSVPACDASHAEEQPVAVRSE